MTTLKTITTKQLKRILELHELYLIGDEEGVQADLSYTDLDSFDLSNANLSEANLTGANLKRTQCVNTNFSDALLTAATFTDVNCTKASFARCELRNAKFTSSNLSLTTFEDAQCAFTSFRHTKLNNTDFSYTNCQATLFHSCDFRHAKLNRTNFTEARLENTPIFDTRILNTIFTKTVYEPTEKKNDVQPIYSVTNVGTFRGTIVFFPCHDKIFAGCWKGNFEEFVLRCNAIIKDSDQLGVIKELKGCMALFESVRPE